MLKSVHFTSSIISLSICRILCFTDHPPCLLHVTIDSKTLAGGTGTAAGTAAAVRVSRDHHLYAVSWNPASYSSNGGHTLRVEAKVIIV